MARDSVVVRIDGDDKGFKKALSGIEKTAVKSLGVVVKGIGVTSAGITALAGVAINSFKDYEQLIGGIDTLFESSSKKVQKNAAKAYKTAGMSANEYMQMTMSFSASLKQSFEDTAEGIDKAADVADMAIGDMSDNANKMGTDMELIKNAYQGFAKQNYTMLDNLKLGYGGTKTEMERLLADAQKLSGVKYDINNLADVYNAIHVIQTELGITGTTAKEAASTIEGSLNMMKASYSNLMTGLADDNADFDKLLDEFIDSILVVGDNILPRIKTTIEGIGEFVSKAAAELLPEVADVLIDTLPSLLSSVGKLADGMGDALIDCFNQVSKNAPEIVDAAVEIGENFIDGLVKTTPKLIKAAGKMIASLADALGDAVPILKPITSITEVLGDNLETVARVALAVVSAFKAFTIIQTVTKAVSGLVATYQTANLQLGLYTAQLGVSKIANIADLAALSAKEIVVGVLTGKIGLATAAQYLWNAVMSANPIGLLITAVAALATGIGVLVATQNAHLSQTDKLIEKNREEIDSTHELASSYEKLKESKAEQMEADLVEILNAKSLFEELKLLADANGRVLESNKGRVSFILNELNAAMGTEYSLIDGQIQKYGELCSSIDNYLLKKQAQIFLDANEEVYTTAVKNKTDAINKQSQAYYDLQQKVNEANSQFEGLNLTVDDVINGLNNSAEINQLYIKTNDDIATSLISLRNNYHAQSNEVQKYSEDMSRYQDAYAANVEGNYEEVIRILDEGNTAYKTSSQIFAEQSKLTKEQVGENLQKAVSAVEVAYNNLQKADNSVNREALLNALEHSKIMRQAYEKAGGEVVDGYITGMDGKKIPLNTKSLEIMQSAADACGATETDFANSGKDSVEGIIVGISDPVVQQRLYDASYALGLLSLQGYKDGTNHNSPSKEFEKAAGYDVAGLLVGIEKGKKKIYKANYNLAKQGIKGYNDGQDAHSPAKEYIKASKNSVDGLIKGFEDNADRLYKTLDDINEEMLHGEDISNKNLLESERAYLDESLKMENAKEKKAEEIQKEAAEWKLEKLKKTAEQEREILENQKEQYIDYLNERADAAYDAIEEIADAQEKFEKKLYDEVELYTETKFRYTVNGEEAEKTYYNLADLASQSMESQEYTDLLLAVKNRGAVPDELFDEIREMSIEEGTAFAKALMGASDKEFDDYIKAWQSLKESNEYRSKEIFGDDMLELKNELEKEFGNVPQDFFNLGEDAVMQFGEGFINQLEGTFNTVKNEIESSMSKLRNLPLLQASSLLGQTVKENASSMAFAPVYNFYSSGETIAQQLRTAQSRALVDKLRGGY